MATFILPGGRSFISRLIITQQMYPSSQCVLNTVNETLVFDGKTTGGGLTGLIICVRFQVGKSISGVFLWRRMGAETGCGGILCGFTHLRPSRQE